MTNNFEHNCCLECGSTEILWCHLYYCPDCQRKWSGMYTRVQKADEAAKFLLDLDLKWTKQELERQLKKKGRK